MTHVYCHQCLNLFGRTFYDKCNLWLFYPNGHTTCTQVAWGRGELPFLFLKVQKRCPDFAKKKCPVLCIYGLNFYLKYSFKSILEKNKIYFTTGTLFFVSYMKCRGPCYKKLPLPRKIPGCVSTLTKFNVHKTVWEINVLSNVLPALTSNRV